MTQSDVIYEQYRQIHIDYIRVCKDTGRLTETHCLFHTVIHYKSLKLPVYGTGKITV